MHELADLIESWAGWLAVVAGALVALATLWRQVIRPVVRWGKRIAAQVDALSHLAQQQLLSGEPGPLYAQATLREAVDLALETSQATARQLDEHIEQSGKRARHNADVERELRRELRQLVLRLESAAPP